MQEIILYGTTDKKQKAEQLGTTVCGALSRRDNFKKICAILYNRQQTSLYTLLLLHCKIVRQGVHKSD
jgi:hypothetical protein